MIRFSDALLVVSSKTGQIPGRNFFQHWLSDSLSVVPLELGVTEMIYLHIHILPLKETAERSSSRYPCTWAGPRWEFQPCQCWCCLIPCYGCRWRLGRSRKCLSSWRGTLAGEAEQSWLGAVTHCYQPGQLRLWQTSLAETMCWGNNWKSDAHQTKVTDNLECEQSFRHPKCDQC